MIKTFTINDINSHKHTNVLRSLYDNALFNVGGAFRRVWLRHYPFNEKTVLSVQYDGINPIAAALVHHKFFYGWDYCGYPDLVKTYGMVSAFVKPEYRNQGLAKALVDNTLKEVDFVQCGAFYKLSPAVKHLSNIMLIGQNRK